MYSGTLKRDLCNPHLLVVILVVLTESGFRFSLFISHILAKAIPVRGAKFNALQFKRIARRFSLWNAERPYRSAPTTDQ
ncbi:hypothetical protein [Dickeya fangzhongdai]|uniref:hypothetical protein n=1 Tax=Dickeya fangzhongdai TaxID=1778540 RepID=UPI001F5BB9FF|nr:hypothetical protein [Dickeya fangzhongdai]